jgi:hypothetical protein
LYDPCTVIGVSSTFTDHEAFFPVAVGATGTVSTGTCAPAPVTVVGGSVGLPPSPVPAGYPSFQDAVYTDILRLSMTDALSTNIGIKVLMGSAAPAGISQDNFGEVQAENCAHNSGGSCVATGDFPALSFFDVFFDIELPGGLGFHNWDALTVQSAIPTGPLPPNVFYTHTPASLSIPVYGDRNTAFAFQVIGEVALAGHGVNFSTAAQVHAAMCAAAGTQPTFLRLLGCLPS